MDEQLLCIKMDRELRVKVGDMLEKHKLTPDQMITRFYRHILEHGVPAHLGQRRIRKRKIDVPPRRTFKDQQEFMDYCDFKNEHSKELKKTKKQAKAEARRAKAEAKRAKAEAKRAKAEAKKIKPEPEPKTDTL